MYHPMLTFAIAQTRLDDLNRDLRPDGSRRRLSPVESYDLALQRASLSQRLARYATRRIRPSVA
ncbi:hypothetical protein [Marmoricola sp. URHB0036]|uniref:hypothetical protein n=1 Tax=Marmoricola sp. URHB0036 TaxID=1298863 RepID=UPI0004073ADD|nr:hypothetical protein [Marmoricola sp. URHB0036]